MTSLERVPSQGQIPTVGREVRAMFGSIAAKYDFANSFLSMGVHKWWRRKLADRWRRCNADRVLDLCTGTGDVLFDLESDFPFVVGADFCFPMVEQGKKRDESAPFLQGDAMKLPFQSGVFGLITVAFGVRNFESRRGGLEEVFRVLKPGGSLLILEFGQPRNWLWRTVFQGYSTYVLPFLGGAITGNRAAYEYLPRTSRSFPCGEAFVAELSEIGFENNDWESLTGGVAYLYYATKPSA